MLLFNDLSLVTDYFSLPDFADAIGLLMRMRQLALKYGRPLYCHKSFSSIQVAPDTSFFHAINLLPKHQQPAFRQWITREGPFWDDVREHRGDDYFTCNDHVVTDTALGEAAYLVGCNKQCQLMSVTPSKWEYTPVVVDWVINDDNSRPIEVINHWQESKLDEALRRDAPRLNTWTQLEERCRAWYPNLHYADACFKPLYEGHPFVFSPAARIQELLSVLDRFKCCFDESGKRTEEGHQIYQDHFTGDKCWFSDSSDTEKEDFKNKLTFPHPDNDGETLFCTWHGKIKTPQYRIHFSYPISPEHPLYIVYIGAKITKR